MLRLRTFGSTVIDVAFIVAGLDGSGTCTVTSQLAKTLGLDFKLHLTKVFPSVTAVTLPFWSTVTIEVSKDSQTTSLSSAFSGVTVALMDSV